MVKIPKFGSNKIRTLGISSLRDKIIQKGLQNIIEAIWENIFLDCSHGFRPGKSAHSALRGLYYGAKNFV
jgi:retron-type reverse transcriptase